MTVFAAVDAAAALRPCCERYRDGHAAVDIYIKTCLVGWGVVGLLGRMGLKGKWVDKTTP